MAQVMVNFRIDEDIKKSMEQACKEMGLSMTTAFTIFATKVGKEKRIPFEITAGPQSSVPDRWQHNRIAFKREYGEEKFPFMENQERLENLCTEIRRSLTSIHTAIPSSITGVSMERIRLLCGNELKDKTAGIYKACRTLSGMCAEMLQGKDLSILNEYMDSLSSIMEELREIEYTLVPTMKSWSGGDTYAFEAYAHRLAAVSQKFDGLLLVMQRFLRSSACSGAQAVQARIRQAASAVETDYILTALERLETLILRHYDSLEAQTKARLEADYLQTLELTLRELGQTERSGSDIGIKATLCLRTINVLSQVISDCRQARQEWNERSLEAEVTALERLAAVRGDIAGGITPNG